MYTERLLDPRIDQIAEPNQRDSCCSLRTREWSDESGCDRICGTWTERLILVISTSKNVMIRGRSKLRRKLHQAKRQSGNRKAWTRRQLRNLQERRGTTSIHRECRIVSPAMMQRPPSAGSTSSLSGSWNRHSHPLLSGSRVSRQYILQVWEKLLK